MIIGISGKIGSGKNTVADIIQWATSKETGGFFASLNTQKTQGKNLYDIGYTTWQQKMFAAKLKQIACLLTGCTMAQLEDQEFKKQELGEEWIRYGYADGFYRFFKDGKEETVMNNKQCDKERYEIELKTNWQTAYKEVLTYRSMLQKIGTDCMRDNLHINTWVNALFADYKPKYIIGYDPYKPSKDIETNEPTKGDAVGYDLYPNWIITDVRFPNEFDAIKERGGLVIRINRRPTGSVNFQGTQEEWDKLVASNNHPSETSLDNHEFDHVIDNNDNIEALITKVSVFLDNYNLLK